MQVHEMIQELRKLPLGADIVAVDTHSKSEVTIVGSHRDREVGYVLDVTCEAGIYSPHVVEALGPKGEILRGMVQRVSNEWFAVCEPGERTPRIYNTYSFYSYRGVMEPWFQEARRAMEVK